MLVNIFHAFSLVFLVFGVFFVLVLIFCKLLIPKKDSGFYAVVAGFEDDERLPEKVYAAYIQASLFSLIRINSVLVLDFGVCESVKNECINLLGDGAVTFCSEKDFADIIGGCA